jgi:3-oxoacyl-[acyl-carrier protein] reductase
LAKEGVKTIITARNGDLLEGIAQTLGEFGADVLPVACDLEKTGAVETLFQRINREQIAIDILINNAANKTRLSFFDTDEQLLDSELRVNVKGAYLCSLEAAQMMREQKSGNIVNISSVGGLRAQLPGLPYGLTKGALDAMTRAMAIDLAEYGIRVNAVAPGAMAISSKVLAMEEEVGRRIPLGRLGTTPDVAGMVAFLVSGEASYITGQVFYVDGGISAQLHPPEAPI